MAEDSQLQQQREIEKLYDSIIGQIRWFDSRALREKKRQLLLQAAQLITLCAVPSLIILGKGNELLLTFAAGLSIFVLILTAMLQVFNPGSRWEQYRLLREELTRLLFELEIRRHEHTDQFTAKEYLNHLRTILDKQRSIWYFVEPSGYEIPPPERRDR